MKARDRARTGVLAIGVATAGLLSLSGTAFAAGTVTVAPGSAQGWSAQHTHCLGGTSTGSQLFEQGPATPPTGVGSRQFSVGADGSSSEAYGSSALAGTSLASLTDLTYSTFVETPGAGQEAPYLIVDVDYEGDGVRDDQLFYDPRDNDVVIPGTWQTWSTLNGTWWHAAGDEIVAVVWSDYIPANGGELMGISVAVGRATLAEAGCGPTEGWAGFVGNVDSITVGTADDSTTFDFDWVSAPEYKDQCKKGGFAAFSSPSFKNQGQCVSWAGANN